MSVISVFELSKFLCIVNLQNEKDMIIPDYSKEVV